MAPKTILKKSINQKARSNSLRGEASGNIGKPVAQPLKKPADEPTRAMVLIHGAGSFPQSDIEAIAAKIKQLYGNPLSTFVAYYADWEDKCPVLSIAAESTESLYFKQTFRAELQKQYDALPLSARPVVANVVAGEDQVGGLELLGILTKEITTYLFNQSVAQCIQDMLVQALKQASQFDEITVVSHSMGTMVAFDVLKQNADTYPVSRLITLGSPLGKLRRVGKCDDDLGEITEATVKNWYNVFDTTDIVADAISPSFPKPGYRIHDIFVEVANTMPDAHDYFNNSEALRLIVESIG